MKYLSSSSFSSFFPGLGSLRRRSLVHPKVQVSESLLPLHTHTHIVCPRNSQKEMFLSAKNKSIFVLFTVFQWKSLRLAEQNSEDFLSLVITRCQFTRKYMKNALMYTSIMYLTGAIHPRTKNINAISFTIKCPNPS